MGVKTNCVFCKGDLENIFSIKNMPTFMGAVTNFDINFSKSDMTFTKCTQCGCVQIKQLINPEILYQNNHNIETVGELWNTHYVEFSEFIKDGILNKTVLELADPSCKIAKHISEYSNKWDIVEYNPNVNIQLPKVKFIKKWFDTSFESEKYDVLIHSHFFEHLFNPIEGLKKMNDCLNEGGTMYFSVPNLEYILDNGFLPGNVLHFEHTFFYKKYDLVNLLNLFGFMVDTIVDYKTHSMFFKCIKVSDEIEFNSAEYKFSSNDVSDKLFKSYNNSKSIVRAFKENTSKNKFIFGCHISTQSILSMGIDTKDIINFLDNSVDKQNKFLYGYDIKVESPNIIASIDEPVVMISHTSVYKTEIEKQLKKINKNVILI
jgi:predicted SAM-dependent methyltransferase